MYKVNVKKIKKIFITIIITLAMSMVANFSYAAVGDKHTAKMQNMNNNIYNFWLDNITERVAYCLDHTKYGPASKGTEYKIVPYSDIKYKYKDGTMKALSSPVAKSIEKVIAKGFPTFTVDDFNQISGNKATETEYRRATQESVWEMMGIKYTSVTTRIANIKKWIINSSKNTPEVSVRIDSSKAKIKMDGITYALKDKISIRLGTKEVVYGPYTVKKTGFTTGASLTLLKNSTSDIVLLDSKGVECSTNVLTYTGSELTFYVKVKNPQVNDNFTLRAIVDYKTLNKNVPVEYMIPTQGRTIYGVFRGTNTIQPLVWAHQVKTNKVVYFSNSWVMDEIGNLKIIKKEAGTNKLLEGIKFAVIYDANKNGVQDPGEKVYYTNRTDSKGEASINNLPVGQYLIKELFAGSNGSTEIVNKYVIDADKVEVVTIENAKTTNKEIFNTPKEVYGFIQINKKDAVTDSVKGVYANMSGIRFKLTNKENPSIVYELTTNLEGVAGPKEVLVGTYIVEELTNLNNYVKPANKEITVTEGTIENVQTVEVENEPYGKLEIIKKSSASQAIIDGAEFEIIRLEDDGQITKITSNNCEIEKGAYLSENQNFTTENGEIALTLPQGRYEIREVKAPEDYIILQSEYEVEVLAPSKVSESSTYEYNLMYNGETKGELTIYNKPINKSVKIVKKDTEGNAIKGVTFNVYNVEKSFPGELIGTYTTNEKGELEGLTTLKTEKYRFEEVNTPLGYMAYDYNLEYCLAEKWAEHKGLDKTEFFKDYEYDFTYNKLVAFIVEKSGITTEEQYNALVDEIEEVKVSLFADLLNGECKGNLIFDIAKEAEKVAENEAIELNITNTALAQIKLKINKKDATSNNNLSNTTFAIIGDKNSYIAKGTTNSNGELLLDIPEYNVWLEKLEEKTLNIDLSNLKIEYDLYEMEAAEGYRLPGDVVSIPDGKGNREKGVLIGTISIDYQEGLNVNFESNIEDLTLQPEISSVDNANGIISLTIYNEEGSNGQGKLYIDKYDSKDESKKLSATFKLERLDGTIAKTVDGILLDNIPSNTTIANIPVGQYYLKEVSPQLGYKVLEEPILVAIEKEEITPVQTVNVPNDEYEDGIRIVKIDTETNEELAGAVFKISKINEETKEKQVITENLTTEIGGTVIKLEAGLYEIEEIQAPEGYILPSDNKCMIRVEEGQGDIDVSFKNQKDIVEYIEASLKIKKVVKNKNIPLEGVIFELYFVEEDGSLSLVTHDLYGNKLPTIETDQNGEAQINHISAGNYKLKEIFAPKGYGKIFTNSQIKTSDEEVKIAEGESEEIVYEEVEIIPGETEGILFDIELQEGENTKEIENDELFGDLLIKKVSEEEPTVALENAKFVIRDLQGSIVTEDVFGNKIGTIYNDQEGVLITDSEGQVRVNNLLAGSYTIEEIEAPYGYAIKTVTNNVEVIATECAEITIANRKNTCNLTIVKVEQTEMGANMIPIAGVKFKLQELDASDNVVKEITQIDGTKSDNEDDYNIITDAEGKVTVTGLKTDAIYRFIELEAPERYVVTEEGSVGVYITSPEETQEVYVRNEAKKGTLKLIKTEAGTTVPVAGAEFLVIPVNALNLEEYDASYNLDKWFKYQGNDSTNPYESILVTTNENGEVETELLVGTYYIKEVTSPENFILSDEVKTITITEDSIIDESGTVIEKVTFENEKEKGSLELQKVNNKGTALQGATFKIYRDINENGTLELEGTNPDVVVIDETEEANAQGKVTINNLPMGKYIIEEVKAPAGYKKTNDKYRCEITKGNTTTILYKVGNSTNTQYTSIINEAEKGSLKILKLDADNANIKLEGAIFEIYKVETDKTETKVTRGILPNSTEEVDLKVTNAAGEEVIGIKTDANGIAQVSGLEVGTYKVKEIEAPVDYSINVNNSVKTVVISANENSDLTFENAKAEGKFEIIKVDEDNTEYKMKGARFNIYLDINENSILDEEEKQNAIEVVSDAEGKISQELKVGKYLLQETQAPAGYEILEDIYSFEIKRDKVTTTAYKKGSEYSLIGNKKIKVPIKIVKVDEKEVPLQGATFTIYGSKLEGSTYSIDTEQVKIAETASSNENGIIEINDLDYGVYFAVEKTAPAGYYLNTTPIKLDLIEEVKKTGNLNETPATPIEYKVENTLDAGHLIIEKLDEETKNKLGAGAEFKVYDKNQNEAQTLTYKETYEAKGTKYEKVYVAENLPKGNYTVVETKAPEGYILDKTPYEFEVQGAKLNEQADEVVKSITVQSIYNTKNVGILEITKEDTKGQKVANAKFEIYKAINNAGVYTKGEKVQEVVSDENGKIKTELEAGTYIIKEVDAPIGYTILNKEYVFEIDSSETAPEKATTSDIYELENGVKKAESTNTIVNEFTKGNVKIKKVKLDTEEGLVGAKFKIYGSKKAGDGSYVIDDTNFIKETESSDAEGMIDLGQMEYGVYFAVETEAPKGYYKDNVPKMIDISKVFTDNGFKNSVPEDFVAVCKISNILNNSFIEIVKLEAGTKTKLSGAEFAIYKCEDENGNYNVDSEGKYIYGEYVGSTTEKQGQPGTYVYENIVAGKYIAVETIAPNGYDINVEPQPFTIVGLEEDADGNLILVPTTIEVENGLSKGGAKIRKKTEDGNGIAGVKFSITGTSDAGKEVNLNLTTSADGTVEVQNIPIGTYTVTELSVPEGYYKAEPQTITVKKDITTEIIVKNIRQKHDIKIVKKDQFNKPISAGAIFELYKVNADNTLTRITKDALGKTLGEIRTDKNGEVKIRNIPSSKSGEKYIIKEVGAPEGYIDDKVEKTIVLTHESDTQVVQEEKTVEFVNRKIVFDLSLEKWISKVSDTYPDRNTLDANVENRPGDIFVKKGDVVVYTIRIFNHGNVEGYATKIIDDIPYGLEFIEDSEINKEYGWKLDPTVGYAYTEYLKDKKIEKHNGKFEDTMHKGLNYSGNKDAILGTSCDECNYRDVKLALRVTNSGGADKIVNIAQIGEHSSDYDTDTYKVQDVDSIPDSYGYTYKEGKDREDDEDIAVIIPKTFNLKLDKWINSYTIVQDGKATNYVTGQDADTTTEEKYGEKLVKIDLAESKLKDTDIIINYSFRVTNIGDLPGYVKELTDYIPVGMELATGDNKDNWTLDGNQAVTTKGYEEKMNTLLNSGEYVDFELKLRWNKSKENLDVKTNTAEISKDYNFWGVEDENSMPGNLEKGEDDMAEVPVLLTVQTGERLIKYMIIFTSLSAMLVVVILIKKYMKRKMLI